MKTLILILSSLFLISCTSAPVKSTASLSQNDVEQTIQQNISKVDTCYKRNWGQGPKSSGELDLTWRIGPDGGVGDIRIKRSTLMNPKLVDCVMNTVAEMKFPEREAISKGEYTFGLPVKK